VTGGKGKPYGLKNQIYPDLEAARFNAASVVIGKGRLIKPFWQQKAQINDRN
jgi:hypothetical protein